MGKVTATMSEMLDSDRHKSCSVRRAGPGEGWEPSATSLTAQGAALTTHTNRMPSFRAA